MITDPQKNPFLFWSDEKDGQLLSFAFEPSTMLRVALTRPQSPNQIGYSNHN